MSLRAKRGNRTEAEPICRVCDCFVVPPRNDTYFHYRNIQLRQPQHLNIRNQQ